MKVTVAVAALQALAAQGLRIVHGNDDGWAELYTRTFNDALRAAGHDVVLSCPAQDQSGRGSRDQDPGDRVEACQYDSCPPRSGPVGTNATRPDLHWVNSYPVTGVRYGIDTFGPQRWDGAGPELVVTGVNAGSNLWLQVLFSGTVGGAVHAASRGIPAIAFSGASHGHMRWDTDPVPNVSSVYAELAANLTNAIAASGKPYLPDGVFLNVNFPDVNDACPDAAAFSWVLTRINPGLFSPRDVDWCGSDRLPTEVHAVESSGCHIAISMGDASDKTDINDVAKQQAVLDKLKSMLTCLPK